MSFSVDINFQTPSYINITGLYPFSYPNYKRSIEQSFERFSLTDSDNQFVIDYPREPTLFLDKDKQCDVFSFLHRLINKTNSTKQIVFKLCNTRAAESYRAWCQYHQQPELISVQDQTPTHYLNKIVEHGYKSVPVEKTKTASLLIGNVRLHKQHVLEWYLNNICGKSQDQQLLSSFVIDSYSPPAHWTSDSVKKLKLIPGRFEDNSHIRPESMTWSTKSKDAFNHNFSKALFNFCVDYVEFEDFANYQDYLNFKNQNPWWHEDMISEKTFKCILFKQPFIRLGMPHSLKKLKEWGFKTFDNVLFDESYDDIEDFYRRADHIFSQVNSYLETPFNEVYNKVYSQEVQHIVDHNYNLAMNMIKSDKYM